MRRVANTVGGSGLLGHQEVPTTRLNGIRLSQAVLGAPLPIIFGQQRQSWQLVWYGDFTSQTAKQQGGSGLAKSGTQYVYSASVVGVVSMGNCKGFLGVWDTNGKYAQQSYSEQYEVSGTYTYTPNYASIMTTDMGAGVLTDYSVTANDYGSPGSITYSGTQQTPLTYTTSPTPGSGEYTIDTSSYSLTAAGTASAGNTTYTGTFSGTLVGSIIISGFTNEENNGTFAIVSNTDSELVVSNSAGIAETANATAAFQQYVFSSEQNGQTVVITYYAYSYYIIENELDVVPESSPYEVVVQYQTEFYRDLGVTYYPSGVALTPVSGTPTETGTYNPNNGTYKFPPGDAGQGIVINYEWYNLQDVEDDDNAPNSFNLTFFSGGLGQEPWSYLTSKHPGENLGYSEVCYVASSGLYLGYSPDLPQFNFEIIGNYPFGNGIGDACPSDCIEALLTDPGFGCGFPSGNIDSSLQGIARSWWCANNFFISSTLNNQSAVMSAIGDWCEAGQVYVSWDEGLLKFTPLGDTTTVANGYTYTPNTQPVIDLDDNDFIADRNEDPITIEQSPWQNRWNRVGIRWSVRSNAYNEDCLQIDDASSINQFGLMVEGTKDYQFITTLPAAQFAANMRLQRIQAIYTTYRFVLKSNFAFLSPGDIVTVTDGLLNGSDYMFGRTPVRITQMSDDPIKGISIEAETFPWSVGAALLYNRQAQIPSNTNQYAYQAPGATNALLFEIPNRGQLYSGDVVYVFVNGSNSNWGGCQVWSSYDGVSYSYYTTISTPARIGMTTNYLPYSTDPDTTDTVDVNMQSSNAVLESVSEEAYNGFVTLSAILSDGGTQSPQMLAGTGINFGSAITTGSGGSQGPLQVSSGTDVPNLSYAASWTNPSDVTGDSGYATVALGLGTTTTRNSSPIPAGTIYNGTYWEIASAAPNQLRTTGTATSTPQQLGYVYFTECGFNIPSDATITGVEVFLNYISQSSTSAYINGVQLCFEGSGIGTAKSIDLVFSPTTQTLDEGSASDLWSTGGLTPAQVNDPSFGFGFEEYTSTVRTFVWNAYVAVSYTVGTSSQTSTASHYLECTYANGNGFSLPTNGIGPISGIVVSGPSLSPPVGFGGYVSADSGSPQPSLWAQLIVNGTPTGTPKQVWNGAVSYPTSPTQWTLGSETDTWGINNLTAAQVNAQFSTPAFGVAFYATMGGTYSDTPTATVDVNDVAITIYWGIGSAGVGWLNPQNVASASDFATAQLTTANNTIWLLAQQFGFSLPFGVTCEGIQIGFDAYASALENTATVPATTMPWAATTYNAANYPIGTGGLGYPAEPGTAPVVMLTGLTEGQTVTVTATGTYTFTDGGTMPPEGMSPTDNPYPEQPAGPPWPIIYVQNYNTPAAPSGVGSYHGCLVLAFTDDDGNLVQAWQYGNNTVGVNTVTVPSGATQLQVGTNTWGWGGDTAGELTVTAQVDAAPDENNLAITMFYGGQQLGQEKNLTLTSTNTNYILGSPTDLWGFGAWSIDEWNDPSFGPGFSFSGSTNASVSIQNVRVTLYGVSVTNLELIAYENAELVGQNTYALSNLRRGVYGSYPCNHPAGSTFARMDNASFQYKVDPTYRGDTLYFKFLSFNSYGNNLQSLSNVAPFELVINDDITAIGAIDSATGVLTTGTAITPVSSIDTVASVVQGTYGAQNVPRGYSLVQKSTPGTGIPVWQPIISGGGGAGEISNVFVTEQVGNFAANPWDYVLMDTTAGASIVTLPLTASNPNLFIIVKKVSSDTNTVTLVGTGSDTIEGASSLVLSLPESSVQITSDGVSNWDVTAAAGSSGVIVTQD